MRRMLQNRGLRLIFVANLVSMIGSGMNTAAVTWYILQATHSEMKLGTLVVLQTIPAILMLPFTGVLIDREDRRRVVMLLDGGRAVVIATIAVLAFMGRVHVWQLYLMAMLVAAGFWMFWPAITALMQELTPESEFVHANTLLLAGLQGGWILAGAMVGFVYNHIGLGGILSIDVATYVISLFCYFAVRKGRVVVAQRELPAHVEGGWGRFVHELSEGLHYLRGRRHIVLLGIAWALFIGAMLTQGVTTAPLSDRILHAGARGYGWLNAGWAAGAFTSALYAPAVIAWLRSRRSVAISMALLACCLTVVPFSHVVPVAVLCYFVMGTGRGIGGVAISTSMMETVPKHFMGRVQNTFYFLGTLLQLVSSQSVGAVAHRVSLTLGFAMIGVMYAVAAFTASWPVKVPAPEPADALSQSAEA